MSAVATRGGASIIARVPRNARLDVALVERGLAESRARAQAAIMAGLVRVDGHPVTKPGSSAPVDSEITVQRTASYVSRGGAKLASALDALGVDVTGANALDVGASTGGFTDCLLQRGAARAIALDVGYGQLAWSLRTDERVTVMERTNARHIAASDLAFTPDVVVCDVSFIGVGLIWPAVVTCLATTFRALVMVKPQFELGPKRVGKGGVVRDDGDRAEAVRGVAEMLVSHGARIGGVTPAGLAGPNGNREVFVLALGPDRPERGVEDVDAAIRRACAS